MMMDRLYSLKARAALTTLPAPRPCNTTVIYQGFLRLRNPCLLTSLEKMTTQREP